MGEEEHDEIISIPCLVDDLFHRFSHA